MKAWQLSSPSVNLFSRIDKTMNKDGIIIITGGSRGIGASIASALLRAGYRVACLSRSGVLPALDNSALLTDRCTAFSCDVTRADSMRAAFEQIAALGHPVVGLVNNAGVHLEGPSKSFSLEDYDTVFDTNAKAVLIASQCAYPLLEAGGGLIVNIGSFFDKMGVKRNLAYCASKAAVAAMTRCLAVEWAGKGISVMNIAPGYIVTDLNKEAMESGPLRAYLEKRIPRGTPGTSAEVANVVAALYATDTSFLTGETIYIDGAQGIAH
jgi:NAD(P)-dependent dehydrogenase (short-subunit alcohol dehydrogenase family)